MFAPDEIRVDARLYLLELEGVPVAQFLDFRLETDTARLVLENGLSADLTLDHWFDDTEANPENSERSGAVVALDAQSKEIGRLSFATASLAIYEGPQHDHHNAQGPVTLLALDCGGLA
jgi:hypothetical protein